jgi:hypothetical protein
VITDDIVRELKWLRVQMESALEQYERTGERRYLAKGRSQSQEFADIVASLNQEGNQP